LTSGRRPIVKIISESLLQNDEQQVVPTPLCGIRVEKRKISVKADFCLPLFSHIIKNIDEREGKNILEGCLLTL
jgi:hypothetical protein